MVAFTKISLSILFLNLLCFTGYAQESIELKIDSLRAALKDATTSKGELYHELSGVYARIDTDSAIDYASKERAFAVGQKDSTLYAQSYNDLGVAKLFGGRFDEAVEDFELASSIHTRLGNDVLAAKSLNNIGAIHEHKGELEMAMNGFIRALAAFEQGGEEEYAAQAKNNVASIHNRLRNFERALSMFRELEAYRIRTGGNEIELAYVRGNMANSLRSLGSSDSAVYYYQSAINILEKSGSDRIRLPQYYVNLGQVYRERNEMKTALGYYEKGKALAEETGSAKDYGSALLGIGIAKVQLKEYKAAVAALQESIPYLKASQLNEQVHGAHYELISAFAGASMPDSAIYYAKLYRADADEIQTGQAERAIAELEAKYQTAKQAQALSEERAARLDDQLASRERTLWLIGALGIALLLGSVGYLLYRQQLIQNRQQAQESELKLALARIEAQNELQEQRLRISRDLHDNIGAQLSFIISTVDNVRLKPETEPAELTGKLDKLSSFASGTVRELRDTVWAMNKESVSVEDLQERIANFIERARAAGDTTDFHFSFSDSQIPPLGSATGMNVYRIIQEAVHNALKHAEASRVDVAIAGFSESENSDEGRLQIEISDDGKGIPADSNETGIRRGGGNGMRTMRQRAEEVGGNFEVVPKAGGGTLIRVSVPFHSTVAIDA